MSRTKLCRKERANDARKVCAIVVTFHPVPDVVSNLEVLRPQVQGLIVVDNNSTPEELAPLIDARQRLGFKLIRNPENLGVASALNIGIREAIAQRYDFVALFDQDSTATQSYISRILAFYTQHPQREQIAIVGPVYKDRMTGVYSAPQSLAPDGGMIEIMTSGSVLPVEVFERCGYFEDALVIDQVDHEFSARVRDYGMTAVYCPDAVLLHAVGASSWVEVFCKKRVWTTNHSAKRRYYMTRNSIFMAKRYWRKYPSWTYKICKGLLKDALKILIAEDQRWYKLASMVRGFIDGLAGRMGQTLKL